MKRITTAIVASCLWLTSGAESRQPNIVVIMADDVGHECFGCYGSEQYKTPQLDQLARSGIQFNHGYSQPLCTPSRVKIMTGKSNVYNYVDFSCLAPTERTFAHVLKDAGYATCIAGKWQLLLRDKDLKPGVNPGTMPEDAGFDEHYMWQVKDRGSRYWQPTLTFNGETKSYTKDQYGPDLLSEQVLGFMERNKDKPFLVYYPMLLVHSPFPVTPLSEDKDCKDPQKNFEDMVFYMDYLIGKLAAKLDELSIRDNTLIVFMGDNGTHGSLKSNLKGRVVRGSKGKTIDDGIHVPFIANWKGHTAPQQNNDLVHIGDIFPTVAELAGAKMPEGITGRSFAALLNGKVCDPRESMYMYYNSRPSEGKGTKVLAQTKEWKLYSTGELYQYSKDILEKESYSAGSEPERASVMRAKLQELLDAHPKEGLMIAKAPEGHLAKEKKNKKAKKNKNKK
ncbi:MAG: sulfatase-like hydrolase/transferase [Planctomycetes bacterium]|nr:sulfatase-like hydrolase/transferase [Planctomycetota bacterium]